MRRGRRRACALIVLALSAAFAASPFGAGAAEPTPLTLSGKDVVPVLRPGGNNGSFPVRAFLSAEEAFQARREEDALSRFLDIAYNAPDDERKALVWARVGELLLAKGDLKEALSAADRAIPLARARYFALVAMEVKLKVYQRLLWRTEARQLAAYLVDQQYVGADVPALLTMMARFAAEEGRGAEALKLLRRAAAAAAGSEGAEKIRSDAGAIIDGMADVFALREAAETEEDTETRTQLFAVLGKIAVRKGFHGMAVWALDKAARGNGARGKEATEQLFRLEKIAASRSKIVGLAPLSGKFSDIGFAVLSGAEVALAQARRREGEARVPVLRWADTAGAPERARKEFSAAAADRSVVGVIGPLTGEEGRSVAAAFGSKSPPVLYLGQKAIPEKPFLYTFGLSPLQEARAVLSHLGRTGVASVLLFHPQNGYGQGYADAVGVASKETGLRVTRTFPYPPGLKDFTEIIRKAAGEVSFTRAARSREKGKNRKIAAGAIVLADRWDRVFQLAAQFRFYDVYAPLAGFSGWNDEELIRKAGDAVTGAVFSVDYAEGVPGVQGEIFRKEFHDAFRRTPSRFEALGYDGASLFAAAWALDGPGAVRSAAEGMRERIPRVKTFQGVTGGFVFGTSGDLRRKVTLLRVELGNFVPVPDTIP